MARSSTSRSTGTRATAQAGKGGAPVTVPISPPAYVVRQQTGAAFPTSPRNIWEGLGGVMIGAGATAVLVGVLPSSHKWVGALISFVIGGIGTITSPIGTWTQEISGGAAATGGFWLMEELFGQLPSQQIQQ